MPTAMKNRPSSRPLNGSMSVSSSRRYSLSASSTPARKAPSAIDRPTACISAAVATTSSSEAAVKISGVSLLGDPAQRRPQQQPAAEDDRGDRADRLGGAQPAAAAASCAGGDGEERQQRQDRDRGDVLQQRDAEHALARGRGHAGCARRGRRGRSPSTTSPGRARRRRASRQSMPKASAPSASSARRAEQLHAAPAEDRLPQRPEALRLELQADQEQHQHDAELGEVAACSSGR